MTGTEDGAESRENQAVRHGQERRWFDAEGKGTAGVVVEATRVSFTRPVVSLRLNLAFVWRGGFCIAKPETHNTRGTQVGGTFYFSPCLAAWTPGVRGRLPLCERVYLRVVLSG